MISIGWPRRFTKKQRQLSKISLIYLARIDLRWQELHLSGVSGQGYGIL